MAKVSNFDVIANDISSLGAGASVGTMEFGS